MRQMRLLRLQLPPGMHLYQLILEPPGRAYISPRAALVPSQEAASVTRPRVALISVARGRPAFIKAEPSLRIQALDAQKLSFVRHFCCPEGSFPAPWQDPDAPPNAAVAAWRSAARSAAERRTHKVRRLRIVLASGPSRVPPGILPPSGPQPASPALRPVCQHSTRPAASRCGSLPANPRDAGGTPPIASRYGSLPATSRCGSPPAASVLLASSA